MKYCKLKYCDIVLSLYHQPTHLLVAAQGKLKELNMVPEHLCPNFLYMF